MWQQWGTQQLFKQGLAYWLCSSLSQACVLADINACAAICAQLWCEEFHLFKEGNWCVCINIQRNGGNWDKHYQCSQKCYLNGIWCIIIPFAHLHICLHFSGCILSALFITRGPFVAANVWQQNWNLFFKSGGWKWFEKKKIHSTTALIAFFKRYEWQWSVQGCYLHSVLSVDFTVNLSLRNTSFKVLGYHRDCLRVNQGW